MTKLKVRARAVDMLGRQQIAGIPNAIHELFKNAHDAYADRVEVDYFRNNHVLVIRDDGYGMTRSDVENRWLTLGTESRLNANSAVEGADQEWRGPRHPTRRSIMGEKGIGRLAIAVIAPITLLLTRAARPEGLHNLVVALVHWGIFEQPGLDIGLIDIPIEEFSGGKVPTQKDVSQLVDRVEANLDSLADQIDPKALVYLKKDLARMRLIGPDLIDNSLNQDLAPDKKLTLSGSGYGTTFIVIPVAPELDDDIDGAGDGESSKLERNLLGFSNWMALEKSVIRTEFRDHGIEGVTERIGPKSFFSADDFNKTDQLFEGEFNSDGQFVGSVSIYGKSRSFVCNWIDGKGRAPRCGPFRLKYGYVQGRANESRLAPADWVEMTSKTQRVGGLYIYRDGIRVLPYGNSDVDWLDIEKRRTYSARDWFFSYRRGFGYIEISHQDNSSLTEKAGREGFRENLAYRDFRSILVGFFKQLAYEFFRATSPQGDDYSRAKEELVAQAEILKKQSARASARRAAFEKEIDSFFSRQSAGYFEKEADELKVVLRERIDNLSDIKEPAPAALKFRQLEVEARQRLRDIYQKVQVSLPRGLALTKNLSKDWAAYQSVSRQIAEDVLQPLQAIVDETLADYAKGTIPEAERREFALRDMEDYKADVIRELAILRKEAADASEKMTAAVADTLKKEFSQLRVQIENATGDFAVRSVQNPHLLDSLRAGAQEYIRELVKSEASLFGSLKRQMIDLTEAIEAKETLDDRLGAIEARNQVLEEQLGFYSEFAQMGMSVGILQHEFEGAARGIRGAISNLKPWADKNAPLQPIYKNLRTHVEHLDGYLKALDPLGRRLHRSRVTISGSEIIEIVRNVFQDQLSAETIELEASMEFRAFKVEARSSALVGAFINIIDNAIYWLNVGGLQRKAIKLDADRRGFLLSNNGPAIEARLRDRIFELGETQRPGGRGLGLAISKEALGREGFELILVSSDRDSTVFGIFEKESNDG
ncbi:ATP-binding protein [Stenotrophomonas sp. Sa5BUN4]|uniref:ATP-binding protein n=1 Tax=Stenotrophomonas lacuserhaii TaxID=2760084 RepID=A0A8X8FU02_9GAMM|nr:ATP-binding protein [Stenotrophomonas pennii]MBD7954720.1 ATP-binding protein [Stenotrophomonas pennii]